MIPLLNEFKDKLLQDGMYPHNVGYALKAIVYFSKYMKSEDMAKISNDDIKMYKAHLADAYVTPEGNKLCEETALFRLYSIGEYFKFLVKKERMLTDPTFNVELPNDRYTKYIPTEKDIEDMISKPDPYSYTGIRDRAVLLLACALPLLPKDYPNINVQDVDLKRMVIHPAASIYKEEFPIDKRTCEAIEKYLKVTRPVFLNRKKRQIENLFLNEWGDPFGPATIYAVFWSYRGDKRIDPCSVRHARAVSLMRRGASRDEIQLALGHRSPKIARLYKTLASTKLETFPTHYHYDNKYGHKKVTRDNVCKV